MFESLTDKELDVIQESLELFYSRICDKEDEIVPESFHIYNEEETVKNDKLLECVRKTKKTCYTLKITAESEIEERQSHEEGDWTTM